MHFSLIEVCWPTLLFLALVVPLIRDWRRMRQARILFDDMLKKLSELKEEKLTEEEWEEWLPVMGVADREYVAYSRANLGDFYSLEDRVADILGISQEERFF